MKQTYFLSSDWCTSNNFIVANISCYQTTCGLNQTECGLNQTACGLNQTKWRNWCS